MSALFNNATMSYNYPKDYPEFEDVLIDFSNENTEYRDLLRERTHGLVENVFLDEDGNIFPEKTINRNRELTRVRVFHILKQLEENPRWQEEKARLNPLPIAGDASRVLRISASDEEWKAAPRTMLKTLQDIFTSPTERIAFKRGEFCGEGKDMSCIVIDPATITRTKLRNFGLDEFIPPKGQRMPPAERMSFMAGAIPEIKKILGNLESIRLPRNWHESDDNYFRLMRIGTGKKEGYVLGTQVVNGKKTMFVTDIHKAYRRLFHIMQESYKHEIKLLRELEAEILKIHADLADWPMSPEDLEKTRQSLYQIADSLKHVTDKDKVEIRKLIDASVELKTKRTIPAKYGAKKEDGTREVIRAESQKEQINPKATRARLYPSRITKYFQSRVDRIRRISSHLSQDNVVSEDYITMQQIPFDEITGLFEGKKVGVNMDRLPTEQGKKRTAAALQRITKICSLTQGGTAPVEPYLSFSKKVLEHAGETRRLLDEGGPRQEMAAEFMKIYFVAKIQNFYRNLQSVYGKHISPAEIPDFTALKNDLHTLQSRFFRKKVQVSLTKDGKKKDVILKSKSYSAAYEKIYVFLKQLTECAGEAAKLQEAHPEKTDDLKRLQQAMRKHVREFGFPELIVSIQPDPQDGSDYVIEEK